MFNNGALTNLVNRRIGSNLQQVHLSIVISICMTAHLTICVQMYTMVQAKRKLCRYDDKRYLLVDLPDGCQNPHTHAYDHHDQQRKNSWWPTSLRLAQRLSYGIVKSALSENTPA